MSSEYVIGATNTDLRAADICSVLIIQSVVFHIFSFRNHGFRPKFNAGVDGHVISDIGVRSDDRSIFQAAAGADCGAAVNDCA